MLAVLACFEQPCTHLANVSIENKVPSVLFSAYLLDRNHRYFGFEFLVSIIIGDVCNLRRMLTQQLTCCIIWVRQLLMLVVKDMKTTLLQTNCHVYCGELKKLISLEVSVVFVGLDFILRQSWRGDSDLLGFSEVKDHPGFLLHIRAVLVVSVYGITLRDWQANMSEPLCVWISLKAQRWPLLVVFKDSMTEKLILPRAGDTESVFDSVRS